MNQESFRLLEDEKESSEKVLENTTTSTSLIPRDPESFEVDLANRPNWSVEANFMALPIFTFDRKQSDKSGRIVHSVPIVKNGTVFTSKLVISATGVERDGKIIKDSLPGAFDMQVLFCLMDMWDEQGRPENGKVTFRLNTVCSRLKMNDSGRSYEQVKSSIYKLKWTAIESTKAFYSIDKADHISIPISMIEDYVISTHRGNTKVQDACMVVLGKHILNNLMKNYTAKINRKVYQMLDVGFAQRILSLVLFRQQIENETGVIDFELMDLARLIPMNGKLYPSTIISRLGTALSELQDKKVLKHEYIKVGKSTVLRLTPFEQPENFLVGSGNLKRFLQMVERVYGKTLMELIQVTPDALERMLDRNLDEITYSARRYSWVYHSVDVFLNMIRGGYKANNPSAVLRAIMETEPSKLEYPDNYIPIDVQYKELLSKEQIKRVVEESEQMKQDADDVLYRTAFSYVKMLSPHAYERYSKLAIESKPLSANSKAMLHGEMAEFIFQDIKAGKKIDLQSGPALPQAPEGNA